MGWQLHIRSAQIHILISLAYPIGSYDVHESERTPRQIYVLYFDCNKRKIWSVELRIWLVIDEEVYSSTLWLERARSIVNRLVAQRIYVTKAG